MPMAPNSITTLPVRHSWPVSLRDAAVLQRRLAPLVRTRRFQARVKLLAGADAAYLPEKNLVLGAAVVWDPEQGAIVEQTWASIPVTFPYRTGFLTFREAPVLLAALARLTLRPQVFLFDGQGRAHPRGIGLAVHAGLWLNAPSVGCAKTRLVGTYEPPGSKKGDISGLFYQNKKVGAVVRTRAGVRPVFVSPGHLMDVAGAVRVVLAAGAGFRQPEPLRQAHLLANRLRARLRDKSA